MSHTRIQIVDLNLPSSAHLAGTVTLRQGATYDLIMKKPFINSSQLRVGIQCLLIDDPLQSNQRLSSCSLAESLKSLLSPLAHVTIVFGVFYRQIEISMLRCDLLQKFDKFCGGG